MSENLFEPPSCDENLLNVNLSENPKLSEIVGHLENLLQQRRKLSCPSDHIDLRILSVVQRVLDTTKSLTEQDLLDDQKQLLIKNIRLMIKEANDIIEKTLKIRPY